VPLVQESGVTTPTLVAFDATRDFAPRPYTIYERVDGELVGFSESGYTFFEPAWRKIGEDLAVLHSIEVPAEDTPKVYVDEGPRHQKWVERALERETIDRATAGDIEATIERWSEVGGPMPAPRLIHNDLHPWNLLASPRTGGLAAIIDWGDASFGDPARDFAMMPLPCVPTMLEAYTDDRALRAQLLARSLVVGMAVALFEWCSPEMRQFNRDWWRMPRGGWREMKATCQEFAPRYS
jgi:aminoglycoside phosphotransferase (APT) family kinase protein